MTDAIYDNDFFVIVFNCKRNRTSNYQNKLIFLILSHANRQNNNINNVFVKNHKSNQI